MGTNCLIDVQDDYGKVIVSIFSQYDGYLEGFGAMLADILSEFVIVDGLNHDKRRWGRLANGMECLAAQLVAQLKCEAGGIYLVPPGTEEAPFHYLVFPTNPLKDQVNRPIISEVGIRIRIKGLKQWSWIGHARDFDVEKVLKQVEEELEKVD